MRRIRADERRARLVRRHRLGHLLLRRYHHLARLIDPDNPHVRPCIRITIIDRRDPNQATRSEHRPSLTRLHESHIREKQTRSGTSHISKHQALLSRHIRAQGVKPLTIRDRRPSLPAFERQWPQRCDNRWIDPEDGNVAHGIQRENGRPYPDVGGRLHLDGRGSPDDALIGDNQAAGIDDKS